MIARKPLLQVLILAMFALIPVSVTAQTVPEGIPGETYYAAFPVSITPDGRFDEWSGLPTVSVTTGPQLSSSPFAAASLTFAAAADNDNLYVSVQVTDANLVMNQHSPDQYWNEDSVEIYINASGDPALTEYTPAVAQFTIPSAGVDRPAGQAIITGKNFEGSGVRATVVRTSTGYAVEAAIPLRAPGWNITPVDGGSIGFQIQLNSASQRDRDVKLSWSNDDQTSDQSHLNPSLFGTLFFFQDGSVINPTPPPPPPPAAPFSVRGTTIYDPDGNVFVPKGVNISGYNWVWDRHSASDASLIADCWRFNLVRVNSFLFTGQVPYQQFSINNNLDEIVNAFTSRGIVVVFEGHDRIGSYYQGDDLNTLINWFVDLASRYRDNPYVWFDVMNEPGDRVAVDVDQWVNMHGRVIEAIRSTAQNQNIIIVEGAFGGQDAGNADANPVTESAILQHSSSILNYNGQAFQNIVFSIHTYDLWNFGDAKLADFLDRVQAQNLALVVGEYGVYTDQDTLPAAQSTFSTTIPRGIGRIVWHWDGGDANDLTVNTSRGGGWEINDCSSPTNLSWLGQQIWNDNHTG